MKDSKPLVSVVTLCYKKFDKLYETIRSVLNQKYENIEYIIADDNSDNFDVESVRKFIEKNKHSNLKRVEIICNEVNVGTVKNINNAYKKANGKYIVNLSCNDVFFNKNVLNRIVDTFLQRNCDVLLTSRIVYKGNYEPISFKPHYCERKYIEKKYYTAKSQNNAFIYDRLYDMASGSALAVSNKMISSYNYFNEEYILWEDGPFFYEYTKRYKMEFDYNIISIWYQDGGVSASFIPISGLMKKDIDTFNKKLFDNKDKNAECNNKRYSKYRFKRNKESTICKKLLVCVTYPDYALGDFVYYIKREINKLKDKYYIKKYKNKTKK